MATIKDVANLAGVGLGTASRVLSGKGSVSPATLARVQQAIEQLDFRPSHAARSLLSGSSQMIGVYIPVLKGAFYTPILQALHSALHKAGLNMVLSFGIGDGDARRQAVEGLQFLTGRGCDGLFLMNGALTDEDVAGFGSKQVPLVVVNRALASLPEQCFAADHVHGGQLAAKALLKFKHKKFAVIAGPADAIDNTERIRGFVDELARAGIDTDQLWIAESDFSPEGGWTCAEKLLASGYEFTALFCANDEMAIGALSFFQQAGVAVPEQVSVIGYDDTHSGAFTAPRLTSVHMPMREISLVALNHLLNICYDSDLPVRREYGAQVTWRASVAKAPAAKRHKN